VLNIKAWGFEAKLGFKLTDNDCPSCAYLGVTHRPEASGRSASGLAKRSAFASSEAASAQSSAAPHPLRRAYAGTVFKKKGWGIFASLHQ